MTARQSYEMTLALRAVQQGKTIREAREQYGVSLRGLQLAMRRAGMPPKPVGRPKG